MGEVFYLGVGWPQWKPLGIPGTHLPLKRGNWLKSYFGNKFDQNTVSLVANFLTAKPQNRNMLQMSLTGNLGP